ncbi:MAG: PAS domain S-box protein [Nitrospinae bacterium]|nr:PAS domain S-box protein [Nitrospinota bacterium]
MSGHNQLPLDIFNSFEDGVYIVGQQHDIEYINPVIEREFGKVDGRKCHEYFHGRAEMCPWCGSSEAFAGKSVKWEWCSTDNGRHYELLAFPIPNAGGGISKLEIRRDVTRQKSSEERMRLLQNAMEHADETLIITDAEGIIEYANPAAEKRSGYPIAHLLGKKPSVFKSGLHDASFYGNLWNTIKAGRIWKGNIVNRKADGSHYEENVTISPVPGAGGAITHFVSIRRDISEQKHLRQQLYQTEKLSSDLKQREKNISFEMHELKKIVESNTDTFYAINPEGRLIKWNRTLETLTGLPPQELMLKPAVEFFHEEDRPLISQKIREVFEKGYSDVEARFIKGDGTFAWHLCNGYLLKDANGAVTGFAGTGRDISERKRMEETMRRSEERYRELFENASDYVYTNDLSGLFTSVNKSLCERSGYRPDELAGAPIGKLVSAASLEKARTMTEAKTKEGRSYTRYELEIIAKNGEIIPIELNSRLIIENGKPVAVQGIGRDISERKRAEEKLKAAKEEAEAATLLKDKFISLLSHDLRAPLSTVTLLQKVAISKHADSRCDECMTMLGNSIGICETMLKMTDNLLESAKLQTGNIQLRRRICNVRDICDIAIDDLRHLAETKGVVLKNEVPADARFYLDKALFQRVVHNLVMNAVKFSAKGGMVTVFLPGGNNKQLAVKDAGTGISKKLLPDLFKYEIKTSTAGTAGEQGTGFGLPISMDIMKAHGGTIRVTSQKGEGSTFTVEMPDMRPLVLVADDDEVSTFALRTYLENMGAEVLAAQNGAEALEIVQEREPALIITDLKMPVMDGFALLHNLKTGAKHSHIPVIIITGSNMGDIDIRQKAFEHKADDFITKPLSEPDFIPRVSRFIAD